MDREADGTVTILTEVDSGPIKELVQELNKAAVAAEALADALDRVKSTFEIT